MLLAFSRSPLYSYYADLPPLLYALTNSRGGSLGQAATEALWDVLTPDIGRTGASFSWPSSRWRYS